MLRPQQVTFEDTLRQAFARCRAVCGVAPTGFGKGYVIADMAARAAAKGRKVLVVTNRRVIVKQLHQECSRAGLQVGIIMGSEDRDEGAPVQVASIQTLKRRGYYGMPEAGFVIIDEAHQEHKAYRELVTERANGTPVLGLTATPVGPGGIRLDAFGEIVEPIKNSEVIEAGDLLPVRYIAPFEPDMEGLDLKRAGQNEIGERVDACTIYADVFREWQPFSDMQTLAILPSRATANGFLRLCKSRGISAKVVDGTTGQTERDEAFSEFREEDARMLISVDVLREGFDAPNARVLLDIQPTHQFRVFWQKIGRVKRPHPGQTEAIVIDVAGNIHRHLTHPDTDPPWDELTNDPIETLIESKAGVRCPNCKSKDVYSIEGGRYRCEDCKHTWETKKPWVCPSCKQALGPMQKVRDGCCPNCGEKISQPVRRVRMGTGEMRVIPVDEMKKRKKCKANSEQAAWDKWRWIAHHTGKKLGFARKMYHKTMGKYPKGLKNCPDDWASADWGRSPAAVYPWMNKRKEGCEND